MVSFDMVNSSNEEDFHQEEAMSDDDTDLEVSDGNEEYQEDDDENEENISTEVRGRELRNLFGFLMNHQQYLDPQILSSDTGTVIACPFCDFTAGINQIAAYNDHLNTHDEYTGEQLNVIQDAAAVEANNREIEMFVRHVLENASDEDVVDLAARLDDNLVDNNQVIGTPYGQVAQNRINCQECDFACYNLIEYIQHVESHERILD